MPLLCAVTCKPYSSLVILALLLMTTGVHAARDIYKYQDDEGNWVFSDIRPKVEFDVSHQQVAEPDISPVRVLHKVSEGNQSAQIIAVNNYAMPVTLSLSFTQLDNAKLSKPLTELFHLDANSRQAILDVMPAAPGQWRFQYQYSFTPGSFNPNYDANYAYQVPFSLTQTTQVSQGFNGAFTHSEPHSRYAIDIPLPEGTPVLAARAGVVVEVVENNTGAATADFAKTKANVVRLAHDDGSMTVYAHLKTFSSKVRVGQRVNKGQTLALSGNTGFSTGPHLHFAVQINQAGELVAVPFLLDIEGQAVAPSKSMRFSAGSP
ncbi:M23 family metallopeptidase [Motilimonas eburnea]|uniref:M23 family metallopeptidase n=1 Tax=Motilimonas eburnea TaxID=1737488 RepID=UPI001E5369DF|nr:M23 family metallopeptidase [Motilimonas eburnea]MCE2571326.1 M23 family metallopeptidase [Motilimonas eburnea]